MDPGAEPIKGDYFNAVLQGCTYLAEKMHRMSLFVSLSTKEPCN